MKRITAVIRPATVEAVREALVARNIHGMTVTEARGFGRQLGHKEIYRGAEYDVAFMPKIKVDIVVEDGDVEHAVGAITDAAKTGKVGDGKIFISPVDEVICIRTGEHGKDAL